MKFAASTIAPVKFSDNAIPVSAIIWLCMNVALQKPVQLQMPHCVRIKTKHQSEALHFSKAPVHSMDNIKIARMKAIDGGTFPVGKSYGMIEIDHFCYYCIESVQASDVPENLYRIVAMKEIQPNIIKNLWNIHICVIPSLPTCLEVCLL